jgi:hypothetical protein
VNLSNSDYAVLAEAIRSYEAITGHPGQAGIAAYTRHARAMKALRKIFPEPMPAYNTAAL